MIINKKTLWLTLISGLIFLAFLASIFLINFHIIQKSSPYIFSDYHTLPNLQSPQPVAIVLGALVHSNGQMSDMLTDRVAQAITLYRAQKIQKILVSGDHGQVHYDEVNVMKNFLLIQGVLPTDIFLDHAGFDTYDSLYRAHHIFGIDSAVIITQEFHLSRAVYIGRSLGMNVSGLIADRYIYAGIERNQFREILARVKAYLNVNFHSQPKYLGPPIPITGDSRLSWD